MRPEVPVTPVDERQDLANNSPLLAADPTNPRRLVLASRLDNPDFGCALHLSEDGGRSWVPTGPVTSPPAPAEKCYAPEMAFERDGTLQFLFVGLRGLGNTPVGAYLATSTDGGLTFGPPRQVLGPERYMVRLAIDPTWGRRGRMHLIWLQTTSSPPLGGFGPPPNPIMAAFSDDGGATFSDPVQVSDPERSLVVAPAVAVGSDHRVHVAYYDLVDDARDYRGLAGPRWDGTWTLVVSSSTAGGRTFLPGVVVDAGVVPTERVMVIYTMPPPALAVDKRANLITAWSDGRNGDWDVLSSRSTNGGSTWSPPRRVNRDLLANGRHQYLPRLAASSRGRVDVVYYDRRGDPANRRDDVRLASSYDGGATFDEGVRMTSEPSDSEIGVRYPIPSAEGLVERGSRLALASTTKSAIAAWTDTRNAEEGNYHEDVFATEADFRSGVSGPVAPGVPVVILGVAVLAVAIRIRRRRASPGSTPSG